METLKENDFIELDYTGKIIEDNIVFDTTIEQTAKENNLFDPKAKYEPVTICLGKRHVISGLDKNLVGKELNKQYTFKISPEDAFGNKNPKLIKLVSTAKFLKEKINPMPGMQVNMDGVIGTIKTVSGGRTVVDFNHPLSGKSLEYTVIAKKIKSDINDKVNSAIKILGINMENSFLDQALTLKAEQIPPKEQQDKISKAITDMIKEVKTVSFKIVTKNSANDDPANNKV